MFSEARVSECLEREGGQEEIAKLSSHRSEAQALRAMYQRLQSDKHQLEAQLTSLQSELLHLKHTHTAASEMVLPNPFSFLASSSRAAGPASVPWGHQL